MSKTINLAEGIPQVIRGTKVEKWLRPSILKSIVSMRFMPNKDRSLTTAIRGLNNKDRRAIIELLISAQSRSSAQSDFMGVVGIPVFLGIFAFFSLLELPLEMLVFYALAIFFYLFAYFYYRLMYASLESILGALRIDTEYFGLYTEEHDCETPEDPL